MRKVRDYYAQKAKNENYPARSIYKLEEAQKKYAFLHRGDSVLDIGCFPGSWSLFAAECVGSKGIVVGVDLQLARQSSRQDSAPIHWLKLDIRSEECVPTLRKIRPSFRVILSDISPKTTGNRWTDAQQSLNLVRETLELARLLLLPKGHFFTKVFQGEDFPDLVKDMHSQFEMVKVLKPKSSRVESREVYILAMGYEQERKAEPPVTKEPDDQILRRN